MAGRYEFRLSGDDDGAGVHHLIAGGGAVAAGAGAVESPDLIVDMSTVDFRALAVGRLPAGAVYVPGRIRVTGDVRLAAGLRHLLGA
jgi:putative sterol carrier protein